jgi:hypothetical protein
MKIYKKESLIDALKEIRSRGWIRTQRPGNDGGVGNTLEDLLGIPENNLAIANTVDWELKSQRKNTSALVTLFHLDPQPRKPLTVVAQHLLPIYGWPHKEAGKKYPSSEMSFRATLSGNRSTDRGFSINVNSVDSRVELIFDFNKTDDRHKEWLNSVREKLKEPTIAPIAFWTFEELQKKCAGKIKNKLFVTAEKRKVDGHEEFYYSEIWKLEDFVFNNLLKGIIDGKLFVDFDARTGHNHGTKFRVFAKDWPMFFSKVTKVE